MDEKRSITSVHYVIIKGFFKEKDKRVLIPESLRLPFSFLSKMIVFPSYITSHGKHLLRIH